jgi:hypothetical protein
MLRIFITLIVLMGVTIVFIYSNSIVHATYVYFFVYHYCTPQKKLLRIIFDNT